MKPSDFVWRQSWVAGGFAILALAAGIFFWYDTCPLEFWREGMLWAAIVSAISMAVLLPAYLLYVGVVGLVIRRTKLSVAARRRWCLGVPVLLLMAVILYSANRARPTVAIQWVLQGKTFRSIRSVHAAHLSTMMSDRRIAWFEIDPGELRGLIDQHQLVLTNSVNLHGLLSSDQVLGQRGIADRIPSFPEQVCYARNGSDDFRHPFSLIVLTNPRYDAAVWYSTYDR